MSSVPYRGDIIRTVDEPVRLIDSAETRSAEIPELLTEPSKVEVVLARTARQTMLGDLFWSTRRDRLEAGGFLFARPTRSWEKTVEILSASDTGDAKRTSGSIRLDVAPWAAIERASRDNKTDLALTGLWHSHVETRDDRPSDADLTAWLATLDWHEENNRAAAYSVGLIYTACESLGDSWAKPKLSGWVTSREGYSRRPVCRPTAVRERR